MWEEQGKQDLLFIFLFIFTELFCGTTFAYAMSLVLEREDYILICEYLFGCITFIDSPFCNLTYSDCQILIFSFVQCWHVPSSKKDLDLKIVEDKK